MSNASAGLGHQSSDDKVKGVDLDAKRRFGPHREDPKARPFGYYPVASHVAGDLASKEGGSRLGKQEQLIPLTEEELRTGVTSLPVGLKTRTVEELKEESGTVQGWVVVKPKTTNVQQPRYGPKFKDWVIASERNQAHRHLAGHRRDRVEEDELYRASNALRYDHSHGIFVDCNLVSTSRTCHH